MYCDYHIHLAPDSYMQPLPYADIELERYAEQAQACGVSEIGISEHCYRFVEFAPVFGDIGTGPDADSEATAFFRSCFTDRLSDYVCYILRCKERGLPVKLGLEVDYVPGRETEIKEALAGYPWDYLIGSVHMLGSWIIDASAEVGWPTRNVDEVYAQYFAVWEQACLSGLFSTMAHPDLVKKFGHRPATPPLHLFQSAAQAASRAGVAIEISSAGLRKTVREIYPGRELLSAFKAAGVPITLGSDAHTAADVGNGIAAAAAWAGAAGYTTVTCFQRMQATQAPLG